MHERIAVAGAGLMGAQHLERLADAGLRVACVIDPRAAAQELADRYGVRRYDDLADMLRSDRPDGVILGVPNQQHAQMATETIEAGLPVLLEKPATATLEEGERLIECARAHDAKVLVGHHRTYSAVMTLAREAVGSGRLGQIVAINGTALFYKPDDYFPAAPWRMQPGGGPLRINMIHEVHNLRLLAGEITSVRAVTSHHVRHFEVEDSAAVVFSFAGGALGTFVLSDAAVSPRSWEQTVQENPSFDAHPDQDCYLVAGTLGSLAIPTMQFFSYDAPADRSWWNPLRRDIMAVPKVDPLVAQLEHFGAVIRGDAEPLVSLEDGVQNVKVIEAIARSAQTGLPVDITAPKGMTA